jgi:hypothetical protein
MWTCKLDMNMDLDILDRNFLILEIGLL